MGNPANVRDLAGAGLFMPVAFQPGGLVCQSPFCGFESFDGNFRQVSIPGQEEVASAE